VLQLARQLVLQLVLVQRLVLLVGLRHKRLIPTLPQQLNQKMGLLVRVYA
jgi:hypothetical protein